MPISQKDIDEQRSYRIAAVAARTQELIEKGFVYDGHTFGLSADDQTKWLALRTLVTDLVWPVTISPTTGEYSLERTNLDSFLTSALSVVQGYKDSGRALRLQLEAANDLDTMIDIVDSRT
tara:strand:+ start:698 stop:1060 length:363 start_codon:yes stop_codon:yes gene_type:complete